jgi:hypothetical protein
MKTPAVIALLMMVVHLSAQQPDFPVRGSFKSMPFGEFVQQAEQQTGVHFFYRPEWIGDITVTNEADSGSLRRILTDCFKGTDLFFFIDTSKNIILTKGSGISTYLPEITATAGTGEINGYQGRNGYIAEIEKSYVEGRRETEMETIVIGNPADQKPGKMIAVRGRLLDKESGEPLIGATVIVKETGSGYSTDGDGQFLMTLPAGTYEVNFRYLGMQEVRYLLRLRSDGSLTVEMNRKLIPLDEVIVVADRFQNVKGTQMGYEHITLKTIKEIPVVLGERDVLKVAQMLPGVQTEKAHQDLMYGAALPIRICSLLIKPRFIILRICWDSFLPLIPILLRTSPYTKATYRPGTEEGFLPFLSLPLPAATTRKSRPVAASVRLPVTSWWRVP